MGLDERPRDPLRARGSGTWSAVSSQWRYSHNYRHHVFSNVVGVDDDLGFGVMRVTRDEPWRPEHLLQPLRNLLLACIFEWGIALHGIHSERDRLAPDAGKVPRRGGRWPKRSRRQTVKDYVIFPALSHLAGAERLARTPPPTCCATSGRTW